MWRSTASAFRIPPLVDVFCQLVDSNQLVDTQVGQASQRHRVGVDRFAHRDGRLLDVEIRGEVANQRHDDIVVVSADAPHRIDDAQAEADPTPFPRSWIECDDGIYEFVELRSVQSRVRSPSSARDIAEVLVRQFHVASRSTPTKGST